MKKIIIGLIVVISSALMPVCHAQDTNLFLLPTTKMEAIQTNIGRVIIKASAQTGTVSAQAGELSVSYKQITDLEHWQQHIRDQHRHRNGESAE